VTTAFSGHDSDGINWRAIGLALGTLKIRRALELFDAGVRRERLASGMHSTFRRASRSKQIGFILHGKREARLLHELHRYRNVAWHPLSFLSADAAAETRATTTRADFPQLAHLPPDAVLIGTFGFISDYKGFDTAIQALRLLPENYHLLIFGGIHPQQIRRHEPINPYLASLLGEGRVGASVADVLTALKAPGWQLTDGSANLLGTPPHDLTERIHFMGALPDSGFAKDKASHRSTSGAFMALVGPMTFMPLFRRL
jgi:glycosyltransferase involved in cell wall biosynthesis